MAVKSKVAISSAIALFLMILLIGTFTLALTYLFSVQIWNFETGGETIKRVARAAREDLEVNLASLPGGEFLIKVRNRGFVAATITTVLLVRPDGSLSALALSPPYTLMPNEELAVSVLHSEPYTSMGVQTASGNIYLVSTGMP
jgi:hypothetical protein